MSFLNDSIPNDLSSRFKKIYSDEYWIKSETDTFIPFQPGGGGEVTLPTWVKSINALFQNGVFKNNTDHVGVKIDRTDLNSYSKLTYTNLQMIENLNSSGGMYTATPSSFFVGYHLAGSSNSDLAKAFTRTEPGKITIEPEGISNESGKYQSNSFTFNKDAVDYVFNLPVLKDVLKLYNKSSLTTPTSDNKMLLYNPTTNDYNYSDIPTASGTSYPYLESTRINMPIVQGLYNQSIIVDSLNSTITCRSKKTSGSDDSYVSISPGQIAIKNTYDPELTFDSFSIKTVNRLKNLAISAQSPLTPNYENQSEYLKFNPVERTFHREFAYKMIVDADTDLIQLSDNGSQPRKQPITIFNSKYTTATIPQTNKFFERIILVVNNLIYNRWYMINFLDDGPDTITMEKTTLSTTLPRIFDGELVYMRSTQSSVLGTYNANATGRTFFKILCPDVTDTSTKCQFTFVVKRWTKSISNHIPITPESL